MTRSKSNFDVLSSPRLLVIAMALALLSATGVSAQYSSGTIDAGTTIMVRTNEAINVKDSKDSDGRVFSGIVEQDVINRRGNVAIPKGSDVELVVKNTSNNEIALDLNAIMVNGRRYSLATDDSIVNSERQEGIGVNKRTGKYVGGGALLGAVIGAIAGGGKGAAIGAGAGAAAGAGAQVLTRGRSVKVPAESLLTFRLQHPLQTGSADAQRYKPTYNGDSNYSAAYRAGMIAGRSDADRNLQRNTRSSRWTSSQDRSDYEAGYNRGYSGDVTIGRPIYGSSSVHIDGDNNVTWQAPSTARVYVQVDNNPVQLFAEGASGTQLAPWIESGHLYLFTLRDMNGNEIARDRLDLRRSRDYRS
jgi:hypothetical protein